MPVLRFRCRIRRREAWQAPYALPIGSISFGGYLGGVLACRLESERGVPQAAKYHAAASIAPPTPARDDELAMREIYPAERR